jgi:hypothetical protein
MNAKKYFVSRHISNPYTSDDRNFYGPYTFSEAMHCMEGWAHTGDCLALCDSDHKIIPENEFPQKELDRYARHALIELEKGRANARN